MYVNIQQSINSKFKYEKIKKILNNPITKFSLGTFGGLTGIDALSLISKLIYDKINNKIKIKLDANDEKFIAKNFFLCKWGAGSNFCWNDVFIQFLMCPDIRCRNYKSEKIMKTINWINEILNKKYNKNCLNRKVPVPIDVRPVPDGFENYLYDGLGHSPTPLFFGYYNGVSLDKLSVVESKCIYYQSSRKEPFLKKRSFHYLTDTYSYAPSHFNYLGDASNKQENYIAQITIDKNRKKLWDLSECFSLPDRNYYPTYIIVHDDINYTNPTHVFAYYVIYNENMKIKYFLKVNDLQENMEIVPKDKVLKELNIYSKFWFVFSRGDIVKKYYVPR